MDYDVHPLGEFILSSNPFCVQVVLVFRGSIQPTEGRNCWNRQQQVTMDVPVTIVLQSFCLALTGARQSQERFRV